MPRYIFTPIANADKYRYVFQTEFYGFDRFAINRHFQCYETMGDGATAHAPDILLPVTLLADYLFSLAKAMTTDAELAIAVHYDLDTHATDEEIKFAESVRFKEGKTRYYSVREKKISATDSKRHDKRYEEIGEWCDGSIGAVQRILYGQYFSPWDAYLLLYKIVDWYQRNSRYCVWDPIDWKVSGDERRSIDAGYEACRMVDEARRKMKLAERSIGSYEESIAESLIEKAAG